jgi:hypothetical protein
MALLSYEQSVSVACLLGTEKSLYVGMVVPTINGINLLVGLPTMKAIWCQMLNGCTTIMVNVIHEYYR